MPTRVKKRRRSPLLPALVVLVLIGGAFLIWRLAFSGPQPSGNLPDWVPGNIHAFLRAYRHHRCGGSRLSYCQEACRGASAGHCHRP